MKPTHIAFALAALALPSLCFGLGFRIPDQDAEATGRGDAFTATADNPSAIYYNPAGITQLQGENILLGSYSIYLQSKYTGPGGDAFRTKDLIGEIPEFYYTNTLKNAPISFGLGVYSPFGLSLAWPDNVPFRPMAIQGSLADITVNPVIAWRINKALSIAAGVTINYTSADLEQGTYPLPGNSVFRGDGTGVGFNMGLMWQPSDQHSFGLNYHSETITDLHGYSSVSVPGYAFLVQDANGRFVFPQVIQGGYSYRPTPDWNFEFDLDWTDWHQLKTITLNQQATGASYIPFNWQSSFMCELGATRYFAQYYHFSLGFVYSEDSVPTSSYNPLIPDSDRYILSTGLGWKKDRFSWDIAYQFSYGPPRSINNDLDINGDFRFISHAITFSIGYSF